MKLCVIAVLCMVAVYVNADKTEGKFKYKQVDCTWKELGAKNSHVRTLAVSCKGNKKKKINQVSCQYTGDPHPCSWYNKHQKGFYECLVFNLAADNVSVCNKGSVSCHNHCQEITFNKKSTTEFFTPNEQDDVYDDSSSEMEIDDIYY